MKKILSLTIMITLLTSSLALASEGAAEPSLFAGTIAQSIATIISFLVLFAILYKMAWGPILTGLKDREDKIKGDLAQAQQSAQDAQKTLAEYQQKLADAQEQTRQLIEESRAEAERLSAQIKDQAQIDVGEIRERAKSAIQAAKEQAVNELYSETATLSTQIAGRILKRELNPADQQAIVDESLSELRQTNNN